MVAKPKDTLLRFATYAHTLEPPRMDVEKELPIEALDIAPADAEMLLSIAKLIEEINDCSKAVSGEHILTCVPKMAV